MEALGGSLQKGMLARPEAHQCCSGAQGDPIEVPEGGYGHSFRVGGLGHGPPRPPPPPPSPRGGVGGGPGGQKLKVT